MRFEREDEIGTALIETLGHELFVASDSYHAFLIYADQLRISKNRFLEVACYQAYANLLRSLYEYYSGIFKLNNGNTKSIEHSVLDNLFNDAAQRLINFYKPVEGINNSKYLEEVPVLFGRDFRILRNRASHADFRRMKPNLDDINITLADFYKNYNFYVHLLLSHPQFSWGGNHYDSYDWKQIESFIKVVIQEIE